MKNEICETDVVVRPCNTSKNTADISGEIRQNNEKLQQTIASMQSATVDTAKTDVTVDAELTEPESEPTDTVTAVTLPEPIEPKVLDIVQTFSWNFSEIKNSLNQKIQKYVGLVVTDDNLKGMEDTQREIAGLRTKIDTFRKHIKKQMNEPYNKFETEIKELLAIVNSAETPLKDQLLKYEDERRKQRETELLEFSKKTATNIGLRPEYLKITIDTKWTNRGAKDNAVKKEIVEAIEDLLRQQDSDDEAVELRHQRFELIEQLCASNSKQYKLSTAVNCIDVAPMVEHASLAEIPGIIAGECQKRQQIELQAAMPPVIAPVIPQMPVAPVMPRVAPAVTVPTPPVNEIPVTPEETYEYFNGHQPSMPPMPPMPPKLTIPVAPQAPQLELYDVTLRFPAITVSKANELKLYIARMGITYKVISQAPTTGQ